MSLTHILRDVDWAIDQYQKTGNKIHYRTYRNQAIQLNRLGKGEFTYYYAMSRGRTRIAMYEEK